MRVLGQGPTPTRVMLIGEAPGKVEAETGRPFAGKSGQELNRMLELNGLDRRDVYVTNVCKERPPYVNGKQLPPSREEIERDAQDLIEELAKVRPLWIGALGRVATRHLTGLDLDMDAAWALSYPLGQQIRDAVVVRTSGWGHSSVPARPLYAPADALDWLETCRIIPLYHPAAGMHNADLAQFVWRGLELFCGYVKGQMCPVVPVDAFQHPSYVRDERAISGLVGRVVACDTEGLPGRIWGGSLSADAGSALVFSVRDASGLARRVLRDAPVIVFQNALHDVPILEEIGIPIDWERVEDTFLMSYCLRLTPLGLKALARRFCGMDMQSYLDVVAPADRKLALDWVTRAINEKMCPVCDGTGKVLEMRKDGKGFKKSPVRCTWEGCIDGGLWPDRSEQLKYDWDTGHWKIGKGWSVGRYLNNLRKDMENGRYEEVDEETGEFASVRTRIHNWPDDVLQIITREVGPLAEPTLDDIDPDAATYYSARDADATIRIYPILSEQIDQLGLRDAYRLDLSVIPVAAEMQKNGMYISKPYFAELVEELEHDNQVILAKLEHVCGRPINPGSGDQVAGLLFGERALPDLEPTDYQAVAGVGFELEPTKFTKSGKRGSVDDKVLEALKLKHATNGELVELIDLILDYRIRDKILGTYARPLPLMADVNGRIHTTIKPCRTATFRWASANPNFQNIPIKEKNGVSLGKRVRMGFIAPPGYVLGSWDFDQVEMRVLAYYSQDENLLRVFRDGLDIHSMTAALIWRVPLDQFLAELHGDDKTLAARRKEQRASAKNIGFGVVYGVTAKGLRAQMELRGQHWTEEECQKLIDMYLYEAYPGIGRWMSDAHAEARRHGYVRSLFGHIRYVPGVHSSVASVREEALRQAANFKIQCTAAELLKLSMQVLWRDYKSVLDEVGARLLMAVHDELLLEVPDNDEARMIVDTVVASAMTNPYPLDGVHVGTTGKYDYNWGALK